jgi:hypothetical protein
MEKVKEQCLAVFEDNICQLERNHSGKHRDTRDFRFVTWTDAGALRAQQEKDSLRQ